MARRLPPDQLPDNWAQQYVASCPGLNPEGRVVFDYRCGYGLGASGYNEEVAYFGFVAFMLPRTFLNLASRLLFPIERSMEGLPALAATQAWGPPTLRVQMDYMNVAAHEGRHRATLLDQKCPLTWMPVHIFLVSDHREWRARHIDRSVLDRIRGGLYDQGNQVVPGDDSWYHRWVRGPLFHIVFVDGRLEEWPDSWDPEWVDDLPASVDVSRRHLSGRRGPSGWRGQFGGRARSWAAAH